MSQLDRIQQHPPLWLHRLALLTAALTVVLIAAGGLVKSKGAGLAVPDWPLSYGMPNAAIAGGLGAGFLVFGLAWFIWRRPWLAGLALGSGLGLAVTYYLFGPQSSGPVAWYEMPQIRAEHGHRLIAGTVGFLTAVLAAACWEKESRRWVRRLSLAALGAVVVQASLGGLTVYLQLPPIVSASHGSLAQAFFAMVVTLTVVTSPGWFVERPVLHTTDFKPLSRMCAWMVAALYVQVLLGAGVRHSAYVPGADVSQAFYWHLAAHLGGLLFVAHTVARVLVRIVRRHGDDPTLARPAVVLAVALGVQILLGLGALLARLRGDRVLDPHTAEYDAAALALRETASTAHVALGALTLGAAVWITLYAYRRCASARAEEPVHVPAIQAVGEPS